MSAPLNLLRRVVPALSVKPFWLTFKLSNSGFEKVMGVRVVRSISPIVNDMAN